MTRYLDLPAGLFVGNFDYRLNGSSVETIRSTYTDPDSAPFQQTIYQTATDFNETNGDIPTGQTDIAWTNYGTGNLNIDGSTFSGNSADNLGCIHNNNTGTVTINNTLITGNSTIHDAAAINNGNNGPGNLIVTNSTVAPLYAARLRAALAPRYRQVHEVVLPDGEEHKDWQTLNLVFDALLSHGCDRKTVLFALGGGVVGDMAGFAAASYMRGVPFVQVPTTLLAQVDSSVGGKTAINHPQGKNMIGAFHQPALVAIDPAFLETLPRREFRAGMYEVVKYGVIASRSLFDRVASTLKPLFARDHDALLPVIKESCEIKSAVVEEDERKRVAGILRADEV